MKTRKKLASIVFLAVVLLLSPAIYAGNLEPSAPPGPTMKTLDEVEPRIPIHASDLPLTITEPNSYYLAENINFTDDANHAITIECNDVTIDLMGYTLKGPDSGSGHGIYMNGRTNVEVRNGTVRDFGYIGIFEQSTSGKGHRVIGVRAVSNGDDGICLQGFGHLVKDCTAAENGGRGILATDGSTITGNTCYENDSFGICALSGSTVTGNMAYENGNVGIWTWDDCTVTGNTAYENGNAGIYAYAGSAVTGNTVRKNSGDGIRITGSSCRVSDNTCDNNGNGGDGAGIHATGSDNRIERNSITNNDRGIDVDASGNVIADNMVKANTDNYDIAADNQINILLCEIPETISWPATVKLAGTLKLTSTTEHAITVNSNDVTIDLAGFSLIGPGSGTGCGIYMDGRTNVEIRNGTVRDFGKDGILEISKGDGICHRVIAVRVVSNGDYGICLWGRGHLIKDCTVADNGDCGILVYKGCTVTGNTAYNNGDYGIFAYYGSTLTGNTAYYSTSCGIAGGEYCLIDQNTATYNGTNLCAGEGCVLGLNLAP